VSDVDDATLFTGNGAPEDAGPTEVALEEVTQELKPLF